MASKIRTVISPGRYVQGRGAISRLGEYLTLIGDQPLVVADDLVWGLVGHDVEVNRPGFAGGSGYAASPAGALVC